MARPMQTKSTGGKTVRKQLGTKAVTVEVKKSQRYKIPITVIINLFDTDLNYFISIILMGVALAEFGS